MDTSRSFAQQNSILNTACGVETPSGDGKTEYLPTIIYLLSLLLFSLLSLIHLLYLFFILSPNPA
jgi:hypothetical protein